MGHVVLNCVLYTITKALFVRVQFPNHFRHGIINFSATLHGLIEYASYIFTENIAQTSFLHCERFKNAFQCFPSFPLSRLRVLLCFGGSIMSDVTFIRSHWRVLSVLSGNFRQEVAA